MYFAVVINPTKCCEKTTCCSDWIRVTAGGKGQHWCSRPSGDTFSKTDPFSEVMSVTRETQFRTHKTTIPPLMIVSTVDGRQEM